MAIGRYRITHPTIAVLLEDERHVTHMVPSGTIITVDNEGFDGDRLIDVTWDDKKVLMFAQDLRSRTEAVGKQLN
jgi:hypothetical protein